MSKILSALACNLDANILLASLPLLEAEKVQAIEWSFDTLFQGREVPPWFIELLQEFGNANRLVGHGVFFSLFSGRWSEKQQKWLDELTRLANEFHFDHVTEHFGFMTGEDFHKGAPISIPWTTQTLAIGQDRLKRIYNACQCPVGLENLAFSYSLEEVKRHGDFLAQLIEPVNGFIILDLHNLYCQLHNFDLDFAALINLYPLDRVREIHISGGSWEESSLNPDRKIRRDTHDDAVPEAVFQLLAKTIPRCPNLKYVVLEQLGNGLHTPESRHLFQRDFLRMDEIVQTADLEKDNRVINSFLPTGVFELHKPLEDNLLYAQQLELSNILETATDYLDARDRLQVSSLAQTEWETEQWAPHMLETVIRIAQKWKNGFA